MLLGVASVPMAPLLQECWVDSYAPVHALMTRADGDGGEEKVQVRLVAPQATCDMCGCCASAECYLRAGIVRARQVISTC